MEPVLLILIAALLLCLVIAVLVRRPRTSADITVPLQQLAQTLTNLRVDLSGLDERVATVKQSQQSASQSLVAVRSDLTEVLTHARARQEIEKRIEDSIRRLEAVIAGTQSKGVAGENLLDAVFAALPAEWQVRGFQVGNKTVEFGLRLPNGLVLPIDSKWPGTGLVEQLAACEEPAEQRRLKTQLEAAVLAKAREVRKYLDPNLTTGFGVAAVPDAVYDLCSGARAEAFRLSVVVISYSLFVPYLLLVFQTSLKASQTVDLRRLDAYLHSAQTAVAALQEEVEGRFSRSLTMLANSRSDMSAHLSKLSGGLTSLQIGAGAGSEQTPETSEECGSSPPPTTDGQ